MRHFVTNEACGSTASGQIKEICLSLFVSVINLRQVRRITSETLLLDLCSSPFAVALAFL